MRRMTWILGCSSDGRIEPIIWSVAFHLSRECCSLLPLAPRKPVVKELVYTNFVTKTAFTLANLARFKRRGFIPLTFSPQKHTIYTAHFNVYFNLYCVL